MIAKDSIRQLDAKYNCRKLPSAEHQGKLHVGHGVVAANASIPSKYQTIVTTCSEQDGFLSRTQRFLSGENENDLPGPGAYTFSASAVHSETPSNSKKGSGGFASKSLRKTFPVNTPGPGPAAYEIKPILRVQQDFNATSATSSFQQPIAIQNRKPSTQPSPNKYDVRDIKLGKSFSSGASAAFRSQMKRNSSFEVRQNDNPPPWQYDVKDGLLFESPRIPNSSFKSKTIRKMMSSPSPNPGPCEYATDGADVKTDLSRKNIFPKKHYLCISAPAMQMPAPPDIPGPGSYELVNYSGVDKRYLSGAVFVSNTSRWCNRLKGNKPGPATYRPASMGKQSFLYNSLKRWVN